MGPELKEFLDMKWPEEVFTKCKWANAAKENWRDSNIILICKRGEDDDHPWVRKVRGYNALIESAFADTGNGNSLIGVRTVMELPEEQVGEKEGRSIFVLRLKGATGDEDDAILQKELNRIADIAKGRGEANLRCFSTLDRNQLRIRKHICFCRL